MFCVRGRVMFRLFVCWLSLLAVSAVAETLVPLPEHPKEQAWPTKTWPTGELDQRVDRADLDAAVTNLFAKRKDNGIPDTRAILIIQHGKIVFEQYADGFDETTRFHSWSAAKSFTNALIGMLAHQDKLDIDEPAAIPAWQNDERSGITVRHMLNMSTGLDISDNAGEGLIGEALYGTGALDINAMLTNREKIAEPNEQWEYSTGTSNLLGFVAGNLMGSDRYTRHNYAKEHLLSLIGADNVVMSYDRAGYFMGGSHVYATARDYARLGYLYLRDGVWDGQRILPEGWVDFTRTPAPAENNGNHSAHFWLNVKGKGWQPHMLPGGPESTFIMSGNGGQYVFIIPTHDLLFIRLGEKQLSSWGELAKALAGVVAVFPPVADDQGEAP